MGLRSGALAAVVAIAVSVPAPARASHAPAAPHVVLALIDTGINPYHHQFRDTSPLAFAHPSTYLPGYPAGAPALNISLDAPDYATALQQDAAIWAGVARDRLYWIPGTRIVGAIHLGAGGTSCAPGPCTDHRIVDDAGHGTMTSSRSASAMGSLAPEARIVMIEGLGGASTRKAADLGFVDLQTNSWLSLVPPPAAGSTGTAFKYAARKHLVLAASGNGTAYITGIAPTPTYLLSTGAPGVVLVGAHDNGKLAPWSGAPPHVVADGYGGLAAAHDHLTEFGPDRGACCTSAASPYAAGGAAAVILEARRILGDTSVGVRNGVVAEGTPTATGPLADGRLMLDELKQILMATAQTRPARGAHDGLTHWLGDPRLPSEEDMLVPWGPGANPFCLACYTVPLNWSEIPKDAPAFALVGYGAINEFSVADAGEVLRGEEALPPRPVEDAWLVADQAVRSVLFPLPM